MKATLRSGNLLAYLIPFEHIRKRQGMEKEYAGFTTRAPTRCWWGTLDTSAEGRNPVRPGPHLSTMTWLHPTA